MEQYERLTHKKVFAAPKIGYVNVMDFGAKGDGWHDDTAAIRRTVEFVTRHGGIVYFPNGTYVFPIQVYPKRLIT